MSSWIEVSIPWNLPCYVPANGFHPLYEALFEAQGHLRLHAFDEAKLAALLRDDPSLYRDFETRRARIAQEHSACVVGERLFERVSSACLAAMEQIPGDIELHHTAPLGLGRRPFLLHCESFLPAFAPFFSQGKGELPDADRVRRYYGRLFKAESCLGILSHFQSTLDEMSLFFRDATIDAKLARTPVGLPDAKLDALLSARKGDPGRAPRFLFTSSAHQNPANFLKRGGVAALLFARRFLQARPQARFVFRTRRPDDNELRDLVFDHPGVSWLDDHLADEQQLQLFKEGDFVLLPSLNVHSVTIMQAMASGAIPVVSDTHGPEYYVDDERTGLVLSGVKKSIWRTDPATGVRVDDHGAAASLQAGLADQMFQRIEALLARPGGVSAMREQARREARTRFRGSAFRASLVEEIVQRCRSHRALRTNGSPPPLPADAFPGTCRWPALFSSPTSPVTLLRRSGVNVLACKGVYYRFRRLPDVPYTSLFPYALHEQGVLGSSAARVSDAPDLRVTLPDVIAGVHAGVRRRLRLGGRR